MPWRILHILGKKNKVGRLEGGISSDVPWLGLCLCCSWSAASGADVSSRSCLSQPGLATQLLSALQRGRVLVAVPAAPCLCSCHTKPAPQGGQAATCQGEFWASPPSSQWANMVGNDWGTRQPLCQNWTRWYFSSRVFFLPVEKKKKRKNPLQI